MHNTETGSLGDLVRGARAKKNITLRKLAQLLSKSPSYISDIENDRRVPGESVLAEMCKILGLDFDESMALAGRLGEETERQLRKTPALGALLRRLSHLPIDRRQAFVNEVNEKLVEIDRRSRE